MRKTVAAPAKEDILVRRTGMIPGTPLKYFKKLLYRMGSIGYNVCDKLEEMRAKTHEH